MTAMEQYFHDNILAIPNATPETRDAAQYMFYKGRKQYNLCGEFCVAYCMQDDANTNNIDDFLNYWEATNLPWWKTVIKSGLARTTGIYDLDRMLAAYGVRTPSRPFHLTQMSPIIMKMTLLEYQAIVGVQIDHTGYLVGRGIPHWVVLEDIYLVGNLAIAKIYNPFTNNQEPYSWRELMTSTGAYKQGIWIERL